MEYYIGTNEGSVEDFLQRATATILENNDIPMFADGADFPVGWNTKNGYVENPEHPANQK